MSEDKATLSDARIVESEGLGAPASSASSGEESPAEDGGARKQTVSEAIVERNRRNARFSTGPRTAEGKQQSRWNALKHGVLVREAIIPVGQGKENREHLMAILEIFRHSFDVRGLAEELIVERIAVIYWKMRRSEIAEVGELRTWLDTINDRILTEWVDGFSQLDSDFRAPFDRHWRHTGHDLARIADLEKILRERGRVTHDEWVEVGGELRTVAAKQLFLEIPRASDHDPALPSRRLKQLLRKIKSTREYLMHSQEVAGQRAEMELAMRVGSEAARHHLADNGPAGKIQRRESSLDMQFHRALGQLGRIQKARGGGPEVWAAIGGDEAE